MLSVILKNSLFFSLLLLASSPCNAGNKKWHYSSSSPVPEYANVALVIGGTILAAVGLYKLCDWLCTKSDETVVKECYDSCKQAKQFNSTLALIEKEIGIPHKHQQQQRLIHEVNEPLFYQLGVSLHNKDSITNFVNIVQSSLHTMKDAHKALEKRIHQLKKRDDHAFKASSFFTEMQQLESQLAQEIIKLEFTHELLTNHQSFFALFEEEASLIRIYERELRAVDLCGPNKHALCQELRIAVMTLSSKDNATYPHMHYIKKLQSHISSLERCIMNLAFNYTNRISAATTLLHKLRTMHELLMIEDAYLYELREYEKARIEQEKVIAQNRQAAALENQAWQMREQAIQLQKQNELKDEELRLEKERNKLLRDQQLKQDTNTTVIDVTFSTQRPSSTFGETDEYFGTSKWLFC